MEYDKGSLNILIETLRRNNFSAIKIHEIINNAWGAVISLRRVQEISKELKDGTRVTGTRAEGSGRPKSETRLCLSVIIEDEIEMNPHLSERDLALTYDVCDTMVHNALHDDLGMVSINDRWVPHELTPVNKFVRVECCRTILQELQHLRNIDRLVVTDEKWFYRRPVGSGTYRCSWQPAINPQRQGIARRCLSEKKFLVMVAVTFGGQSFYKIMPQNQTINSQENTQFLNEMMASFMRGQFGLRWENALLMHDNAKPHTSIHSRNFLSAKCCKMINQPPYSPDTNILDRVIFPMLEMRRRNTVFNERQDFEEFLILNLATLNREMMKKELDKLKERCEEIININGDYF